MGDTRGITYLRAPQSTDSTSRPIGGDIAFDDSPAVYVGPFGPGLIEIVCSTGTPGELAGYWAIGPWDAGDSDVVTATGGTTAYVPSANDVPIFSGERIVCEAPNPTMGLAIIGATGVTGTLWVRRA
ncbi:MAG: hypothetical protein MUF00_01600 [Gemmatimonadaceae bacterium]|jgi:hypothetical protein|nr:hypothetical protein [Gemmatimonadaceae bacterium]